MNGISMISFLIIFTLIQSKQSINENSNSFNYDYCFLYDSALNGMEKLEKLMNLTNSLLCHKKLIDNYLQVAVLIQAKTYQGDTYGLYAESIHNRKRNWKECQVCYDIVLSIVDDTSLDSLRIRSHILNKDLEGEQKRLHEKVYSYLIESNSKKRRALSIFISRILNDSCADI